VSYDNHDGRIRGRKLQERRLAVWCKDPRCAMCRRLVEFSARPGLGFELDHKIALDNGGPDTEANTQVLCCGPGSCHAQKTATDKGHRKTVAFGEDGWPAEGEPFAVTVSDPRNCCAERTAGGVFCRFSETRLETGRRVGFR
jgi:5-methylcytosine-specific restriction enzyme A